MYIAINDVVGEKKIDLSYPICSGEGAETGGPKLQLPPCSAAMFSIGYRAL